MTDIPPPPYSEQDGYPTKNGPPPPPSQPPTAATPQPVPHVIPMPIHIQTPIYGACPIETDCRFCNQHIVTHTQKVAGALPWIIMGVCFILGFFLLVPWCLCCIPFCVDACLDVLHTCPSCKRALGRFTRV